MAQQWPALFEGGKKIVIQLPLLLDETLHSGIGQKAIAVAAVLDDLYQGRVGPGAGRIQPAGGRLPRTKTDSGKGLLEHGQLQVLGHRAGSSENIVPNRAQEVGLFFQVQQRPGEVCLDVQSLAMVLQVAAGKAHLPGDHTAADVVLPAIAQHGTPKFFVDVLHAGALVVHAAKGTGFSALNKVAARMSGHADDGQRLAQRSVLLGALDHLGLGLQPDHIGFD